MLRTAFQKMHVKDGASAAPPICVRGLTKRFKGPDGKPFAAVDALDFTVAAPGSITSLVGPDGAGKTTLLRLLCGILTPDAGKIELFGMQPDTDNPAFTNMLGFMPQRFGLYEELTVYENIETFGALRGIYGKDLAERFASLMTLTNLAGFESRLAGKLSGGMKQKLGLACALIAAPKLLILDEPTVGVDPLSRRELWRIIREMRRETGMTALISTAYLDEAGACDEVMLLQKGRALVQDVPSNLSNRLARRTFSVYARSPEEEQPLARALMRIVAAALSERGAAAPAAAIGMPAILDAVPRGDAVDILTALPLDGTDGEILLKTSLEAAIERLKEDYPAYGSAKHPQLLEIGRIEVREPTLEDAYCSLTFETASQADNASEHMTERHAPQHPSFDLPDKDVIYATNIVRHFGQFVAVADTTFSVRKGEIFGLLGPNGAGKTTTFRMLCGLLKPTQGTIDVAGADLRTAKSQVRARVGYVAQKFSLYERLSVEENLTYFGECYGVAGKALRKRIGMLLKNSELAGKGRRRTSELPLGAKRELAMACALIHRPAVLFLDEATSGADIAARRAFWRKIVDLAEAGTTVIVTTHFMEEAEYCDRFLIQDAGKVLALGSPREVRRMAGASSVEEAFRRIVETHREKVKSAKTNERGTAS